MATTSEEVPPPDEMYLRLARDTDLGDPDALLNVVREVGGMPLAGGGLDCAGGTDYRALWHRLAARRELEVGQRPDGALWHVAEVAARLRVLDACGRVAVAYRSGDWIAPVWAEHAGRDELMKVGDAREAIAWQEWTAYMEPALRRWHVRAVVDLGELGMVGRPSPPTLMEAGALQIMNDLARMAEYHVCANETCGRTFAQQVGGGEAFSRRTGVRYCSTGCKNAQNQREHRRRAKARREGRSG